MSDVVAACRYCLNDDDEFVELESVPREDGMAGEWKCPRCGAVCGVWLDGGTLDLEALRESGDSSSDFVVYTGDAT